MPSPRSDESRKAFLQRCMRSSEARRDFPKSEQRYAFCNSQWRRFGKAEDSLEFTQQDMDDLIRRMEPKVRRGFLAAVARAKQTNTLDELAELIQAGRIETAIQAAARAGATSIADVANTVMVETGRELAQQMTAAFGVTVSFDQANERAVRIMRDARLRLIREFTDGQRRATRDALIDGINRGLNPREQARAFRSSIGLTQRQEAAVQNYRRLLQQNSREALTRELRDRRFDRTVSRAARTGEPLPESQIERMTTRYRERYLKYRSEVIGRTEALRAVNQGTEESVQQAIDEGIVNPDGTDRTWMTAGDTRVREPAHTSMHGQVRPVGEPFSSGLGNMLRYPGDPEAPASETIQCRCVVTTRIQRPTA